MQLRTVGLLYCTFVGVPCAAQRCASAAHSMSTDNLQVLALQRAAQKEAQNSESVLCVPEKGGGGEKANSEPPRGYSSLFAFSPACASFSSLSLCTLPSRCSWAHS